MEQEKHTFNPLPPGAHIISEKDGDRIAEWNGITLVDTSKEKQLQQPVPTIEEAMKVIRNAKPKRCPSTPNNEIEVDSSSQPQLYLSGRIPGENIRNSETRVGKGILT